MSLLVVRRLAYGYPMHPVGEDLDLRLAAGEVVAVLGPNGSGKTTMFRTLLGWLPPLGGAITLDGRPLAEWSRRDLARHLGYVPQAHGGSFPFTVVDVVLMGRTAHLPTFGVPTRHDRDVALASLDRLGAAALAPRVYTELSGGERQLVLIARALAQEPRVLVMDEPTASLDFGNQVRVLDRIAALRGEGMAVLMSTHHPDHATDVADRVLLIKRGRAVGEGAPREVLTADALASLYDIDPQRLSRSRWSVGDMNGDHA